MYVCVCGCARAGMHVCTYVRACVKEMDTEMKWERQSDTETKLQKLGAKKARYSG